MPLATAIGAGLFGRFSRRTAKTLLPIEFGLAAVGLLLIFASSSVPMIAVGSVVTGLRTGLLLPTLVAWAVNRLRFEQRGRGTGLWTGALTIGRVHCSDHAERLRRNPLAYNSPWAARSRRGCRGRRCSRATIARLT